MKDNNTTHALVVNTPRTLAPLGDFVQAFLAGRTPSTLRAYRGDLADFQAFTGAATVNAAAEHLISRGPGEANALVMAYKNDLLDNRKVSPATVNRHLAAVRSLVKVARMVGAVTWDLEVEGVKSQAYRDTTGPGVDGVRRMLDAVTGDTLKATRDRAVLRLLFDIGLRRGEVEGLDLAHVNLDAGTVSILGKGRRERETLTLPPPTRDAVAAWIVARGDNPGPLFLNQDRAGKGARLTATSIYRMVRDYGAAVGIKTRPHGLRHAAITAAVEMATAAGVGLDEVIQFSRHRDIRTLMVYRDHSRNVQGKLAALVAGAI